MEFSIDAAVADPAADIGLHGDLHALLVKRNAAPNLFDRSGKLMPEDQRMLRIHAGRAVFPHPHVRSADRRRIRFQQDLSRLKNRNGNLLQPNILWPIKSKRQHTVLLLQFHACRLSARFSLLSGPYLTCSTLLFAMERFPASTTATAIRPSIPPIFGCVSLRTASTKAVSSAR